MADKKITQFESFQGEPQGSVYFIIASGEADDVNSKNFKIPFDDVSFFVQRDSLFGANSPFPVTEDDSFVKIGGVNASLDKGIQLTVNAEPILSSTQDSTRFLKDTEFLSTNTETQHFYAVSGDFSERLKISGVDVLTGFDLSNDGYNALSSSTSDVNIGDNTATNLSKDLKFFVNGQQKMVISASSIDISNSLNLNSDLTVTSSSLFLSDLKTQGDTYSSGHFYASGNSYTENTLVTSGDSYFNSDITISGTGFVGDSLNFTSRDSFLNTEAFPDQLQSLYDVNGSLYYGVDKVLIADDLFNYFEGHVTADDLNNLSLNLSDLVADSVSQIPIENITEIPTIIDPDNPGRLPSNIFNNSLLSVVESESVDEDGNTLTDDDGNTVYETNLLWTSPPEIPNSISTLESVNPNGGDLLVYSDTDGKFITVAGSAYLNTSSDERLKEDLQDIESSIDKINKITPKYFTWNNNSKNKGVRDIGVIAQNVQEVLPEAVNEDPDGYLTVGYHKIIPLLIQAVQDQQKEIELLKDKLKDV